MNWSSQNPIDSCSQEPRNWVAWHDCAHGCVRPVPNSAVGLAPETLRQSGATRVFFLHIPIWINVTF